MNVNFYALVQMKQDYVPGNFMPRIVCWLFKSPRQSFSLDAKSMWTGKPVATAEELVPIELRRIEASREIVGILARSPNLSYVDEIAEQQQKKNKEHDNGAAGGEEQSNVLGGDREDEIEIMKKLGISLMQTEIVNQFLNWVTCNEGHEIVKHHIEIVAQMSDSYDS
ncbi:hypothetical protein ACFE04_001911 [Oxalis oulophora]